MIHLISWELIQVIKCTPVSMGSDPVGAPLGPVGTPLGLRLVPTGSQPNGVPTGTQRDPFNTKRPNGIPFFDTSRDGRRTKLYNETAKQNLRSSS